MADAKTYYVDLSWVVRNGATTTETGSKVWGPYTQKEAEEIARKLASKEPDH